MLVAGLILLFIFGLLCLVVSIAYLVACFRCSPALTLMTFIPFVGFVFQILLLVNYWHELKGLFFAHLASCCLLAVPLLMVAAGTAGLDQMPAAQPDSVQQAAPQPQPARPVSPSPARPVAPPQAPPEPVFAPGALAEGRVDTQAPEDAWPVFSVPQIGLPQAQTKAIDLQGYRFNAPQHYRFAQAAPNGREQGTHWRVTDAPPGGDQGVELRLRVIDMPVHAGGRVFEPTWPELLAQAGINPSRYSVEYGRIGGIPFARCADRNGMTGRGRGKVLYLGLPSPENPQRLQIAFETDPQGLGPDFAMMCEAFVRSLTRSNREMMPAPADPLAVPSPLVNGPEQGPSSAGGDWHVRGPFAIAGGGRPQAMTSRWQQDGRAWTASTRFGGTQSMLTLRMRPDDQIPPSRVRPVALQGPRQPDHAVYAYGAPASFVRLWHDEVFVRLEHPTQTSGLSGATGRVTYHGFLNQHRVDIELINRADSGVTMAQIEHTLHQTRLASPDQIAQDLGQRDWVASLLAPGQAPFYLAKGVDARQALVLDAFQRVRLSEQFDPQKGRMFQAYPPIEDREVLAGYGQWSDDEGFTEHLGGVETLDEIQIQPIRELRAAHRPKQLNWQARTSSGSVGMTLHIEELAANDQDMLTPVRSSSSGRVQIRLGRRLIQPSQAPDITYREMGNLRVWRVNVPPSGRQPIARCHYLAIVPGKMIVISTSYLADKPEQLQAYDAAVATLVYRDGQALDPVKPLQ